MSNGTKSPFLVGNVLGRGFSILFRNAVAFGTIAILLMIPYAAVSALEGLGFLPRTGFVALVLQILVGFLLPQAVTAAIVYGTFQDMRNQRTGVGDAISRGFSLIMPVAGVAIVIGLLTVLAGAPAILVGLAKLGGLQILLGLGLLAGPIFVLTVFFVATPAVVVERDGVGAAIRRSAELTKGERWRVLGIMAVSWAVGVGVVLLAVAFAFAAIQAGSALAPSVLLAVAVAFYYALNAVMATVTYHDLRVAREGVGTVDIAKVFD